MDAQKFDALARALASRLSRRGVVRGLVGSSALGIGAALGFGRGGSRAQDDPDPATPNAIDPPESAAPTESPSVAQTETPIPTPTSTPGSAAKPEAEPTATPGQVGSEQGAGSASSRQAGITGFCRPDDLFGACSADRDCPCGFCSHANGAPAPSCTCIDVGGVFLSSGCKADHECCSGGPCTINEQGEGKCGCGPAGAVCSCNESCQLPQPGTCCSGVCCDGACCADGEYCVGDQVCSATCPSDHAICNGVFCAAVQSDPSNCGTCGTQCPDGVPCSGGHCKQPRPSITAGPTVSEIKADATAVSALFTWTTNVPSTSRVYVDTVNPPTHAVESKTYTTTHRVRVRVGIIPGKVNYWRVQSTTDGGTATSRVRTFTAPKCPTGLSPCVDQCRDFTTDEGNCGTCGHACTAGETCVDGKCKTAQSGNLATMRFITQYPSGWSAGGTCTEPIGCCDKGQGCVACPTGRTQDCGAACVAMVVEYFNGEQRPSGITSDLAFLTTVRQDATGHTYNCDLNWSQLKAALTKHGLTTTGMGTFNPVRVAAAINAGHPLIVLMEGSKIGRFYTNGHAYGDHLVVIRGVSSDLGTLYVHDPDTRSCDRIKNVHGDCDHCYSDTSASTGCDRWRPGGASQVWPKSLFDDAFISALIVSRTPT
jgi:hypothetical protein